MVTCAKQQWNFLLRADAVGKADTSSRIASLKARNVSLVVKSDISRKSADKPRQQQQHKSKEKSQHVRPVQNDEDMLKCFKLGIGKFYKIAKINLL